VAVLYMIHDYDTCGKQDIKKQGQQGKQGRTTIIE
jgi:hypothetical protein